MDLGKEISNSVKIVFKLLYFLSNKFEIGSSDIYCIEKHNSIPRYAKIKIGFNNSEDEILSHLENLVEEYRYSDKNVSINYSVISESFYASSNIEFKAISSK